MGENVGHAGQNPINGHLTPFFLLEEGLNPLTNPSSIP